MIRVRYGRDTGWDRISTRSSKMQHDCRWSSRSGWEPQHRSWRSEVQDGNKAYRSCFDQMGWKQLPKIWRAYLLARYTVYCQCKRSRCSRTVASRPETWRHCLGATYRKTQQTRMTPLESSGDGQRRSRRGTSGSSIVTIVVVTGQWTRCSVPAFLLKAKGDVNRTRMQTTGRHQETEEQRCVVVLLVL